MRHRRFWNALTFVAALTLLLSGMTTSDAQAATVFHARLTGAQEVPPNDSPARGFGIFTLSTDESELSFDITYSGLIGGPLVGAHFHAGPAGVNAPVVRGLPIDTAGSPDGSFSGVWTAVDAMPLTPELVGDLRAGNIYFNIHTSDGDPPDFPGGEIRNQLTQVPEPSAILLLGSGLAGLGLLLRSRRA
ncbi:MAG: CHRD domain-containing protein [Bryobacteraceae bacterium]